MKIITRLKQKKIQTSPLRKIPKFKACSNNFCKRLNESLTKEEVAFRLKNQEVEHEDIGRAVEQMLNKFKLAHYRKSYPGDLSDG